MNKYLTFWAGILGVGFFVVSTILGAFQFSDYSHTSQFISEMYAIDTPYGWELRYFGFFPAGILLTVFGFSAIGNFPKSRGIRVGFSGLAVFYGIATILVSMFPCDSGCNKQLLSPSSSQIIHNLTGMLTYIFVPISLIIVGYSLSKRVHGKALGFFALIIGVNCVVFMSILGSDPLSHYAGLYQRIIEGGILLWIVACSIHSKSRIDHPVRK